MNHFAAGRFQSIDWVEQTGSTNADLAQEVHDDLTDPRVLFTDEQTAGRGRRGRSWVMRPAGGIMVSFFVPWTNAETAHGVNSALATAVVAAIGNTSPVVPTLKWPNDVIVESSTGETKKLAGILAEAVSDADGVHGVIVGIGLNVSWPTAADIAAAPEDLGGAVALESLTGEPVDREALAKELVRCFDEELNLLQQLGVSALHQRYVASCTTIGRRVRVEQREGPVVGVALRLDPTGALVLQVGDNEQSFLAGDVVHLRDADRVSEIDR